MEKRALIIGAGAELRMKLSELLRNTEVSIIEKDVAITTVMDCIDREKPDILLIGVSMNRKLLSVCQQIYILYPRCVMVMISDEVIEQVYPYALEVGIRKVIMPVPSGDELLSILKELTISESSRQFNLTGAASDTTKTEIVYVFGGKGGTGKTTIAVNLAVNLALQKKKVVLLDLDLQFGNTGLFLGVESRETLAELLMEQRTPTLDVVNSYLTYHPSGLKVLFGPKSPEYAENIGAATIEKLVDTLRNYYDYIIIDGMVGFTDVSLAILDICSTILFVTETDICTLQNSKKALLVLQSLNMKSKIHMVMKKIEYGCATRAEVEKILAQKVEAVIPYDLKNAQNALNQGRPVVISAPRSELARGIAGMVSLVDHSAPAASRKRNPLFERQKDKEKKR